jgi:hypothetical protein
VANQ